MQNKNASLTGVEQLAQILTKIKPSNCFSRAYRKDSDRLVYSELLQFSKKHLQDTLIDISSLQKSSLSQIKLLGQNFINPLFQQIISLAQRQCSQRSILLKLLYNFYKQSIIITERQYQQQIKQKIFEMVHSLQKTQLQTNNQKQELNTKLRNLQKQNEIKWKTFYMIVRDNRVLRRQKGKLMRVIQQERNKISKIHEEMIKIAHENEKNRLLANYQQQESLTQYLKNQCALQKLEKFMNDYPQYAKRILKNDMKTLQILEQNSLNSKVQYIIRTAKESEEILDEYQDLVDVEKPKAILFNVSVQTDSIQQQKIAEKQPFSFKCNRTSQTNTKRLKFSSNQMSFSLNICTELVPQKKIKQKQREKEKIVYIQKLITYANKGDNIKNLALNRRVISLKFFEKGIKKSLVLECNVIKINCRLQKERAPYPVLPTNHRLSTGIRRSKEIFSRRDSQGSSSVFSGRIRLHQSNENKVVVNAQRQSKMMKNSTYMEELHVEDYSSGDIAFNTDKSKNEKINIRKKNHQKMMMIVKTQPQQNVVDNKKNKYSFDESMEILGFMNNRISENSYFVNPSKDQTPHINKQRDQPRVSSTKRNDKKSTFNETDNNIYKYKQQISNISKQKDQIKDKITKKVENYRNDSRMSQDKGSRISVQQRNINIFGQESQRLIEKLFKAIVIKKKEITSGKFTFIDFFGKFMIHQFGPHLQITLQNSVGLRRNCSQLAEAFDRLLSSYQSQAYLELIFSMFARMIVISDSNTVMIEQKRGEIVRRELTKLYIGNDSDQCSNKIENDCNLCSIFIGLQSRFNRKLKTCELYIFLQSLLPCSQQTLSFQQLKQILSIFAGEVQHLKQLMILGQEGQTQLSPHMLCVYALRQNWSHLISIMTYIEEKYLSIFGIFDSDLVEKMISKSLKSEKLLWSYTLLRKYIEDVESCNYSIFKAKYFSLLFVSNQIQRYVPCSSYLNDIANQWRKIEMKKITD